jgi:tRNA dimethylallyltransferase
LIGVDAKMTLKKKTLVIAGPTAIGKTSLALDLAQKYGGEIISADSRQVYKYLDIGTGKDIGSAVFVDETKRLLGRDPEKEFRGLTLGYYPVREIPIWLLDVVEPSRQFNVFEFVRLASLVIADIRSRGNLPLVVGGSGFYLTGLVDGYETIGIPPDDELRRRLSTQPIVRLQKRLRLLDPERWETLNQSDRKNRRRLLRALEVAKARGRSRMEKFATPDWGAGLFLALTAPREKLYRQINERVDRRLEQGMVAEIKKVLAMGYHWRDPGLNTLGYRQLRAYFEKEQSLDEAVFHWKAAERRYARRQLLWFKRDGHYHWFNTSEPEFCLKIAALVEDWLTPLI